MMPEVMVQIARAAKPRIVEWENMSETMGMRIHVSNPWIARVAALLGGLVFLAQVTYFAQTQSVVLDEGLYLYKGFLFVSGEYVPFQDFGPWTNHMPLSFLIPGFIEYFFGLGLWTGRVFSIALSAFFLIGIYVASVRIAGSWMGAAVVWAVAANPALARMYSFAKTQVLAACILIWILALIIGAKRSPWQDILGSMLAGILLMVRLSLAPVLPLVLLYIYYKRGWRRGVWAVAGGLTPVVILHLMYWPGILKLWATWLPTKISPFLDVWRSQAAGAAYSRRTFSTSRVLQSFLEGVRFHFMSFVAFVSAIPLWPTWAAREQRERLIDSIFLTFLFVLLAALHAWASFSQGYCLFCFRTYLAYFSPVGLLIPLAVVSSWPRNMSKGRVLFILLAILTLSTVVGYSGFADIRSILAQLPPSRFTQPLDRFLIDRIGLSFSESRQLIIAVSSLILVTGILGTLWIVWRHARSKSKAIGGSWVRWALATFILISFLLSPTKVLGDGYRVYDCGGNIPLNYAKAGQYLDDLIPKGSLVYWRVYSPTLLLYIPGVRIFPQQLNISAYQEVGNSEERARLGMWNEELDNRWGHEADFLLVQERGARGVTEALRQQGAIEVGSTPPLEACRDDTQVVLFQGLE
jgi:hypothetical protein